CHDLSGLDLWDSLIRIAQSGNDANGEIVAQAVSCCSKALLWNLARIGEADVDKEEDDENVKFESLHERRTQLAAFFKLVIYNLIPIRAAAPIYKYYIRSFNDFGDIMKSTLAKAREINRVHTARMIAHCLELCYLQVESASNNCVERGSEGLQAVKELARHDVAEHSSDLANAIECNAVRYTKIFAEVIDDLLPDFRTVDLVPQDVLDIFIDHRIRMEQRIRAADAETAPRAVSRDPEPVNMAEVRSRFPPELLRRL
ncbi:uncharacterized protein DC041_0007956, partial [Schistosoma bovis]